MAVWHRQAGSAPVACRYLAYGSNMNAARPVEAWTFFANPAVLADGLLLPPLAGASHFSAQWRSRLEGWPCRESPGRDVESPAYGSR